MSTNIPKKIHYFWFGKNQKSELVKKCIASWPKFFPDYEICEWNEDNYDIGKNQYIREAYDNKKWAFVSDYARFDVLYHIGGLYFDTDVEVLKEFPRYLFEGKGFTGVESTNMIAPGLVFACEPNLPILKELLDDYDKSSFVADGVDGSITINMRVTQMFENKGFIKNGKIQEIEDIYIYPSEYFCGFDLDVHEECISNNTLSIHHYAASWIKVGFFSYVKYHIIRKMLKKFLGVEGYRKILNRMRKFNKNNLCEKKG